MSIGSKKENHNDFKIAMKEIDILKRDMTILLSIAKENQQRYVECSLNLGNFSVFIRNVVDKNKLRI